jgi:hypothetical protein
MRSKAGMANRQREIDLRLTQITDLTALAWLGSSQHSVLTHRKEVSRPRPIREE